MSVLAPVLRVHLTSPGTENTLTFPIMDIVKNMYSKENHSIAPWKETQSKLRDYMNTAEGKSRTSLLENYQSKKWHNFIWLATMGKPWEGNKQETNPLAGSVSPVSSCEDAHDDYDEGYSILVIFSFLIITIVSIIFYIGITIILCSFVGISYQT